jgi:hypothetical protein
MRNIIIKNSTTALSFNSVNASLYIENSTIFNSNIGLSTVQSDTVVVFNCNIFNNSSIGLDLSVSNTCNKNILFNNNEGIRNVEANSDISDCYFLKNQIGIRVGFYNPMRIHHNEFDLNVIGLSMSGANPEIEHNNFLLDDVNIEFNSRYVQGYFDYCNPEIINNNFLATNWQLVMKGKNDLFMGEQSSWGVYGDYELGKNYWEKPKKLKDNEIFNFYNGFYFIINNEYVYYITNLGIRS